MANANTGETRELARGLFADLRASPDKRWLATLAAFETVTVGTDQLQDHELGRHSLTVFDLRDGTVRHLAPDLNIYPYSLTWSPDSNRIAAFAWRSNETFWEGRFHVIDISTSDVMRYEHFGLDLVSERERGWLPRPERTAFLGEGLAVFARENEQGSKTAPRFSKPDFTVSGAESADWHLITAGGTSTNLSRGLKGVRGVPLHAAQEHVTVLADAGVFRLYADGSREQLGTPVERPMRYHAPGNFATRSAVKRPEYPDVALFSASVGDQTTAVLLGLMEENESEQIFATLPSPDSRPMAAAFKAGVTYSRIENGIVSHLELLTRGESDVLSVAKINSHIGDVALGHWIPVSYEFRDVATAQPHQLESCLLVPSDARPGASLPMIVDVYPARRRGCREDLSTLTTANPHSPHLWTGLGFAYARLALPQHLTRTDDGPLAAMPVLVDAGIDAIIKTGYVNPERVTLHGFSQGGIAALYVSAHSDRAQAVIVKNSWSNFISHYFGGPGIYAYAEGPFIGQDAIRYEAEYGSEFGLGATPFTLPDAYVRNSPVFLAPQINMPVLMIHSDMDAFSLSQFDEMFGALKRAGKDVRYVRYWGEGHGPSSPANIRDMWQRKVDFLKDYGLAAEFEASD